MRLSKPLKAPLGLRDCWQRSRYVIILCLGVYECIQTEKPELSRRKNSTDSVRACLLMDSLPHYEFFIVVEASKASVLCSVLLYLAVSSVTKLKKRVKILLMLHRHEG